MTNYDEMPAGREMDALVAEKVMGWRMMRGHWVPPEAAPETNILACPTSTYRYSTDIAAAWEVVEKVNLLEPYGDTLWKDQRGWVFGVHDVDGAGYAYEDVTVIADTAPLAICRAALKAVTPLRTCPSWS